MYKNVDVKNTIQIVLNFIVADMKRYNNYRDVCSLYIVRHVNVPFLSITDTN